MNWKKHIKYNPENLLLDIDKGIATYAQPRINSAKSKIKISSLRGKMTKQTTEEIDRQIEELRNEWNRD